MGVGAHQRVLGCVWYIFSLLIVWPEQASPCGSRRKPGVSEASGLEDEDESSIVF